MFHLSTVPSNQILRLHCKHPLLFSSVGIGIFSSSYSSFKSIRSLGIIPTEQQKARDSSTDQPLFFRTLSVPKSSFALRYPIRSFNSLKNYVPIKPLSLYPVPITQLYYFSTSSSGSTTDKKLSETTSSTAAAPTNPPTQTSSTPTIDDHTSSNNSIVDPSRARGTLPRALANPLPPIAEIPGFLISGIGKGTKATVNGIVWLLKWTKNAIQVTVTDPARAKANMKELWKDIKHELHHYWVGSKLLVAETRTSASLVRKVGRGETLTRRERLQLRRTMGDLFRMVPFIIIVIIPFAEFALPVLLKLFPNMLPSQFEKPEYRQAALKKSLNVRLEIHSILQEILSDRMVIASKNTENASSIQSLMTQFEQVRAGHTLPSESIVKLASLFHDELAIENMPHGQLAALAKYAGLSPYGPDRILRAQLSTIFKQLKADDKDIMNEGTNTLSKAELKDACEARGMRAVGLNKFMYKQQLDDWLELSVNKNVPIALLMLSRAFTIAALPGQPEETTEAVLQQTLSSMDPHVVAEVVLSQGLDVTASTDTSKATASGISGPAPAVSDTAARSSILEMKLEAIEFQNSLIKAEAEAKASADASAAAAKAYASAQADPSKKSSEEIQKLHLAAEQAANIAMGKAQVAEALQNQIVRIRASEATKVASTAGIAKEQKLLETVAAGASLIREKQLLAKLKVVQSQLTASEKTNGVSTTTTTTIPTTPSGTVVTPSPTPTEGKKSSDDKVNEYLRSKLNEMSADLEKDLQNVRFASILTAADANNDGIVTKDEIVKALKGLIAGVQTEDAAAALIRKLDSDKDGQVTVTELEKFLDDIATRLPSQHDGPLNETTASPSTEKK